MTQATVAVYFEPSFRREWTGREAQDPTKTPKELCTRGEIRVPETTKSASVRLELGADVAIWVLSGISKSLSDRDLPDLC